MENSTPRLISESEFNNQVKGWAVTTRSRIAAGAPRYSGEDWKKRTSKKLANSITQNVILRYGEASRIIFDFEKHGAFVHYGVGRGYIRVGGAVFRGFRMKTARKNKFEKVTSSQTSGIHRKEEDWFDVKIHQGINQLADIVQEYHGDEAMDRLLTNIDRFIIK